MKKLYLLPLVLTLSLYLLIYFVRLNQGGWEINISLLKEQRQYLDKQIETFISSPKAELLSGIVLGEKKNIPGQLKLALRDTSTLHIVVVSGQNLTLLAALIMRLSGLITRKVSIGLTFLLLTGYTVLTGAEIPVLRAAFMVAAVFIAQILGRESDGTWILILIAGLFLLINPLWILDLSFQLSFLATIGVISVAPIFSSRLKSLPIFIRENISVTIGAQLMVLPVIAQNFHQISLVALPANLLILWTVPYIMIGGAALLMTSFIIQPFGVLIAFLLNILLTYFIYIVQFFSSFSWAWIYVGEYSWIVWVGYYMIIGGILMATRKNSS